MAGPEEHEYVVDFDVYQALVEKWEADVGRGEEMRAAREAKKAEEAEFEAYLREIQREDPSFIRRHYISRIALMEMRRSGWPFAFFYYVVLWSLFYYLVGRIPLGRFDLLLKPIFGFVEIVFHWHIFPTSVYTSEKKKFEAARAQTDTAA
jgi:hypothetical protein